MIAPPINAINAKRTVAGCDANTVLVGLINQGKRRVSCAIAQTLKKTDNLPVPPSLSQQYGGRLLLPRSLLGPPLCKQLNTRRRGDSRSARLTKCYADPYDDDSHK